MEKTGLIVVTLVQEARSWARRRPVSLQGDLCKMCWCPCLVLVGMLHTQFRCFNRLEMCKSGPATEVRI